MHGLEVPCLFRFSSLKQLTEQLSNFIAQLQDQGLV
jgi:hypothetical protein